MGNSDLNVEVIQAEADLSFQNKLQEEFIDRFRRILNSDVYMPGPCRRLAERCEVLLGHLKSHTKHLPVVDGLEDDFTPVFGLCSQIAVFLETVLEMSWAMRRLLIKDELSQNAQQYAHRVDDVSCQIIIKLKLCTKPLGGDSNRKKCCTDAGDRAAGPIRCNAFDPTKPNITRRAVLVIFWTAFLIGVCRILST